jgi:adenine-specific DNA-methyltransferase
MNSLLEKEGMAGQVLMIYIDPPYGVKYGSNFQPFVNKREVTDGKDEDLTQEPEMVKAFRDTWELGIHSYLAYIKDRLHLARELLSDSGSVFVQISDENQHLVRCLMDEVFGKENFIAVISYRTRNMTLGGGHLPKITDFLIWYSKDKNLLKFRPIYQRMNVEGDSHWDRYESPDGTRHRMTKEQINDHRLLPNNASIYQLLALSQYPVKSEFLIGFSFN